MLSQDSDEGIEWLRRRGERLSGLAGEWMKMRKEERRKEVGVEGGGIEEVYGRRVEEKITTRVNGRD